MSVHVHMADGILLIEFGGEVTATDIERLIAEVPPIEKSCTRTPDRLIDFTETTGLHLDYRDIDRAVQARQATPPANPIKSAVVGPRPAQFGLARMFQTLNSGSGVTVEIFRDRPSAIAWLKAAPQTT